MAASATRAQIVAAADRLFYEQGFEHTSFTTIAEVVGLSRGNFYYHFKTKNEILAAVIASRIDATRAMLRQWEDEAAEPMERIRRFIRIVQTNRADIRDFGCPVGTLTAELTKLRHPSRPEATALFTVFRDWLTAQFAALGHGEGSDAMALHVLAFSQGVATLTNAFGDEDFVHREVARMEAWLATCGSRTT
ncbi:MULTISPECIES: TetR/AcrR family transcriptional regulator [unclassified Solwaraspora]|uniref:TetR/AcrR family transcriptional regulator n=1 Tax=unclassified Solwaraspora TaxID=2627926 RepID=UPI00259AEAE2|nr:TetR/AcrR family transcriptional regulator [Solwaraspora sp. WMMA2056]WJK38118.1 TetR/AcrR family transcriptional regulator [Solwaraspora sp. WMMA2056]